MTDNSERMTDNTARLDHVVLWVSDPVAAAHFYEQAVGLEPLRVAEFKEGAVSFPRCGSTRRPSSTSRR